MTQYFDTIVVGAGMVGAALANGLGRCGHRVALVDQGRAPVASPSPAPPDIRVSALSVGSERYLRQLGVWPRMQTLGMTPYRRLAVWDETRSPFTGLVPRKGLRTTFDAADLNTSHLGHIVENRITQCALWEGAADTGGVCVYEQAEVTSLDQDDKSVEVVLGGEQTLRADLVVGADGAGSRIRELAGIGITRDQYGQQALVASVRYRGPVQDITWQAFHPTGPRAFLPLHDGGARHPGESWASLVWYDAPDQLARLKALSEADFMDAVRQAFPRDLPALTAVAGRASFPIARQHARQYVKGRVVLAGDAAHTINPLAGQGVNLGFQDAECLQNLLAQARRDGTDPAGPDLLGQYERLRRPANQRMMLAMDLFYYLFSNRIPPLHLARNLGLGLARGLPFARNRVARYAMGIDDTLPAPLQAILSRIPGRGPLSGRAG